jgi:hypothetical protein
MGTGNISPLILSTANVAEMLKADENSGSTAELLPDV